MEVSSIDLIFSLSGLLLILEPSEVVLGKVCLSVRLETLVKRWLLALVVFSVNSCACGLCERLAVQVLRFDLGDIALVAWDVLSLQVLGWTTKPVFAFLRVVSISNVCAVFVDLRRLRVVLTSGV